MTETTNNRPVPDPTLLTTQQLLRELSLLREILETRLHAMDKAMELVQRQAAKVPSETDLAIARLKELHEEKFKSIKESITEMRFGLTKELESIDRVVRALTDNTNAKIEDIKTRVTIIEGRM